MRNNLEENSETAEKQKYNSHIWIKLKKIPLAKVQKSQAIMLDQNHKIVRTQNQNKGERRRKKNEQ